MDAYRVARRAVRRAVERRWPAAESATLIEFTTGLGANAGGKRRPHWNDTWKGVPESDGAELEHVMAAAWCARVDAEPPGQKVTAVRDTGGLMRYLALHFQKESQQPPHGWRGHRFRTSRGYLAQPMALAREQARHSLRIRRELWKAEQAGLDGEAALQAAEAALHAADGTLWQLVRLAKIPTSFGADDQPIAWMAAVLPCS